MLRCCCVNGKRGDHMIKKLVGGNVNQFFVIVFFILSSKKRNQRSIHLPQASPIWGGGKLKVAEADNFSCFFGKQGRRLILFMLKKHIEIRDVRNMH